MIYCILYNNESKSENAALFCTSASLIYVHIRLCFSLSTFLFVFCCRRIKIVQCMHIYIKTYVDVFHNWQYAVFLKNAASIQIQNDQTVFPLELHMMT